MQISGGTNDAPPLRAKAGEGRPIIPSTPSQIQEVIEQAPELINRFIGLVDQANEIMNDENVKNLGQTLENLNGFTAALANSSGDIEEALAETAATLTQVRATAAEAETLIATFAGRSEGLADSIESTLTDASRLTREAAQLVETLQPLVAQTGDTLDKVGRIADDVAPHAGPIAEQAEAALRDARTITEDLKGATRNISKAADEASMLINEARDPVSTFTNTGLYEFTQLVVEMRALVNSLSRITTEIERDPARFFFGDKTEGFEAR